MFFKPVTDHVYSVSTLVVTPSVGGAFVFQISSEGGGLFDHG